MPTHPDAFWMPFTANRQFRESPHLMVAAGMYYTDTEGNPLDDIE